MKYYVLFVFLNLRNNFQFVPNFLSSRKLLCSVNLFWRISRTIQNFYIYIHFPIINFTSSSFIFAYFLYIV